MNSNERGDSRKYDHLFTFSGANKAGMEGIDAQKQAEIIFEASKNSSYYHQAQKQKDRVALKVKEMKEKLSTLNPDYLNKLHADSMSEIASLETFRNFTRICVVFDMDMFFAAVEIRDNPTLKELPVAVGGTGMICTSNYVARKFGVRSAMPGFIAKKLCPSLVFVPCNFDKYREVAKVITSVAAIYDPNYSSFSLDEVYMDISNYCKKVYFTELYGNPDCTEEITNIHAFREIGCKVVKELREKICVATNGLTCSAGIANNFLLAKLGADINKPNGQFSVPPDRIEVIEFLHKLPCRKIGGIGKVMEHYLTGLGMNTMLDVYRHIGEVMYLFPGATGKFLLRACVGMDSSEVSGETPSTVGLHSFFGFTEKDSHDKHSEEGNYALPFPVSMDKNSKAVQKSISVSRTFRTLYTNEEAHVKLFDLCGMLADDMAGDGLSGKSVTVTVKNTKFELYTRSTCTNINIKGGYIHTKEEIFEYALPLLNSLLPMALRLIGVSVSKLKGSEDVIDDAKENSKQLDIQRFLSEEKPMIPVKTVEMKSKRTLVDFLSGAKKVKYDTDDNNSSGVSFPIDGNDINIYAHKSYNVFGEAGAVIGNVDEDEDSVLSLKLNTVDNDIIEILSDDSVDYHDISSGSEPSRPGNSILQRIVCPVCHKKLDNSSSNYVNLHVDLCLNGGKQNSKPENSSIKQFFNKVK